MFIDVTRLGSRARLRLAPHAIAYLDGFGDGCSIHMIGGEALRVTEARTTIEERIEIAETFAGLREEVPAEQSIDDPKPESSAPHVDVVPPATRRQAPRRSRA